MSAWLRKKYGPMTEEETFATSLPGNPALPGRRQHHARIALGADHVRHDMNGHEWLQAQRDAHHLTSVMHGNRDLARYRTCPPAEWEPHEP